MLSELEARAERAEELLSDLEERLDGRRERSEARLERALAQLRQRVDNMEHDAWRAGQGR